MYQFLVAIALVFAFANSVSIAGRIAPLEEESGLSMKVDETEDFYTFGIHLAKAKRSVHRDDKKFEPRRDYNTIEEVLRGIKSICSKDIVKQVDAIYLFDVKGNFNALP